MNYRNYMRRIEEKIGEINASDGIEEDSWLRIFLKELNEISKDAARELQKETKTHWNKVNYTLELYEVPPIRLLGLEIVLAFWLGWIMNEKHGDDSGLFSSNDCLKRINEAFLYGVNLSKIDQRP